jgi:putative flippase GtrA
MITNFLTRFVDCLYIKPFHKIPKQTFRYVVCGGINFVVTILCYHIAFYYIFADRNFDIGFMVLSPHVASLAISLPVNMAVGFWLQSTISFRRSPLRKRIQFARYVMTGMTALLMTTLLTKLFTYIMPEFPTLAQIIIYCITAVFSFVAQKYFTFRGAEKE